jgi:hypothetical protein
VQVRGCKHPPPPVSVLVESSGICPLQAGIGSAVVTSPVVFRKTRDTLLAEILLFCVLVLLSNQVLC